MQTTPFVPPPVGSSGRELLADDGQVELARERTHLRVARKGGHGYPVYGYWVCQNGFDERGARVVTHGRACSVRDIDNTSTIEMSASFTDTGIIYMGNLLGWLRLGCSKYIELYSNSLSYLDIAYFTDTGMEMNGDLASPLSTPQLNHSLACVSFYGLLLLIES